MEKFILEQEQHFSKVEQSLKIIQLFFLITQSVQLIQKDDEKLQRKKQQAFLYCESKGEFGRNGYWFNERIASTSLNYVATNIFALWHEHAIINHNSVKQFAAPVFKDAIKTWKCSGHLHNDKIAKKDNCLFTIPFTPHKDQNCWQAWQIVVKIIHNQQCRHLRGLLAIYRSKLEDVFFRGLNIEENVRDAYIESFRQRTLDISNQPRQVKPSKKEKIAVHDCWTISKVLRHIVECFIANTQKKAWGETAIAMWLMIYFGEESPIKIAKHKILSMTNWDFNRQKHTVKVDNVEMQLSKGLSALLDCLIDKRSAERKLPIFQELNEKKLERIIKESCKAVFGETTSVTPSSLLYPSHVYPNQQMSLEEARSLRFGRELVPAVDWMEQFKIFSRP